MKSDDYDEIKPIDQFRDGQFVIVDYDGTMLLCCVLNRTRHKEKARYRVAVSPTSGFNPDGSIWTFSAVPAECMRPYRGVEDDIKLITQARKVDVKNYRRHELHLKRLQ